jgi:hypothetical protein
MFNHVVTRSSQHHGLSPSTKVYILTIKFTDLLIGDGTRGDDEG